MNAATGVPDWVRELYRLVDEAAVDDYLERYYTEDVELRFGSAPAVHGRVAVREALAAGHDRHAMKHTFVNVWTAGDETICEFRVRYTMRADGRVVELPSLAILRRAQDGLVDGLRVYIDPTPLG
ncbi:MAG: nuclear transport factor 2 family protein [Solirubrobacteraceae bacterium]